MKWLGISLLLTLSAACTTQTVDVSTVLSLDQCRQLKTGASRISLSEMATLRGSRLLTSPADRTIQEDIPGLLYAVYAGPKPTAGYSLQLDHVEQQGSQVRVHIQTHAPAPDMMVSQVITQPCVVIQIQGLPDAFDLAFLVDQQPQPLHQNLHPSSQNQL